MGSVGAWMRDRPVMLGSSKESFNDRQNMKHHIDSEWGAAGYSFPLRMYSLPNVILGNYNGLSRMNMIRGCRTLVMRKHEWITSCMAIDTSIYWTSHPYAVLQDRVICRSARFQLWIGSLKKTDFLQHYGIMFTGWRTGSCLPTVGVLWFDAAY